MRHYYIHQHFSMTFGQKFIHQIASEQQYLCICNASIFTSGTSEWNRNRTNLTYLLVTLN